MADRVLQLLIVDDEEVVLDALGFAFEGRSDVSVTKTHSGEEAIEKVKVADFDLVLLDLRMRTETEGLEVLSEIKKVKSRTGVMIITAYGDIPKTVEAMKRGAIDFIPKDVGYEQLVKFKVDRFINETSLIADRERFIRSNFEDIVRFKRPHKRKPKNLRNIKGKVLEELVAALFDSISDFNVYDRNTHTQTEEIDITILLTEQAEHFWKDEGKMILVECKNWDSERVGKDEYVLFRKKIKNRFSRCKLGFLVSTGVIAETVRKEMLRDSKGNILVVPIDWNDLCELVASIDRNATLKKFVIEATMT